MNHRVRRQGFGAKWEAYVGQTGGSGLSQAKSRQGVLLGGVNSGVHGQAWQWERHVCRNLPLQSPSLPLPACICAPL